MLTKTSLEILIPSGLYPSNDLLQYSNVTMSNKAFYQNFHTELYTRFVYFFIIVNKWERLYYCMCLINGDTEHQHIAEKVRE